MVDRDMPDLSGDEVLAWIRANERTRELRVVMLDKERGDDGGDPPGASAGATLWLTKPFNPADLLKGA